MDYDKKQKEENDRNIALDFDGVIHNASKGFHDGTIYGEPIKGSLESIKTLSKKYNIIIFTCKAKSDRPLINGKAGIELIEEWLEKHGIRKYISEITSMEIHSVLGKYRRGSPRQLQLCDRQTVDTDSSKCTWISPVRKPLKPKIFRDLQKLIYDI